MSVELLCTIGCEAVGTDERAGNLSRSHSLSVLLVAECPFIQAIGSCGHRQYLQVLLAKCDNTNELFDSDKQLGAWVKESITAIEGFKNHQGVKQACTWVKAGGKVSNGFSLFK